MTEKRFTDDGIEEIENQSFTDNLTKKTYWIDNGLDEIVELLNNFNDENEQLKQRITELEEVNTRLCNFNLHNILDKKNKEINQLKKELQVWKDTAESLECQLAHKIDEVLIDD